jgi:hypothetical protein
VTSQRLATYLWRSPAPTAVDEVLVVEEGQARLVVRRPRRVTSTIGSFVGRPTDEDRAILVAAGPGPFTFELWPPITDPDALELLAVADRVAETCLATPRATVTFSAGVVDIAPDGTIDIVLLATAVGRDPVVFDLRPDASVVHLSGPDGPITWLPMPQPATGFVTAQAIGVGGLGTPAHLEPGPPVGTTLRVPAVAGATTLAVEVAGTLSEALPDEPMPEPFAVRTPEAAIPR